MNLRRKIEGTLTRQAARQAGAIRAAIKNSFDIEGLVADWEHQNFSTMTKQEARAWALLHAQPRNRKAIRDAVRQAIAVGYYLGQNAAQAQYAKARTGAKLVKAAPTAEDIDSWLDEDFWDSWSPGHAPAALLVKPPGALSDLLDKADVTINGLNRTSMNRLGTILGDGLDKGWSGSQIADAIESLLDDPSRALTIANTEMARAMSTASMDTYNGFGVEMVEWLHADFCNCDLCTEAEAMGPQPIGFDWSMGDGITEPPMHPNCICSIAPVIDEGDGSGLDLVDLELAAAATLVKYSEDQPRDENGRFGSGGGDSKPTELESSAREAYMAGGYRAINGYLRNGSVYSQPSFERNYGQTPESAANNLASFIDKSPNSLDPNETFYRGVRGDYAEQLLTLEPGDQYIEHGFTSITSAPEVAELFTDSNKYATVIIQNSDAKFIHGVSQEAERILTKDSKFEVLRTNPDERKVYVKVVND